MNRTKEFEELTAGAADVVAPRALPSHLKTFSEEASTLKGHLVAMEAVMKEMKPKYLTPKRVIRLKGSNLPESDKDEFDHNMTELVKRFGVKIDELKDFTSASRLSVTLVEHEKEIVTYLLERLKSLADTTKKMQKVRYEQPFLLSPRLLPEEERADLAFIEEKAKREATRPLSKTWADQELSSLDENKSTQQSVGNNRSEVARAKASTNDFEYQLPEWESDHEDEVNQSNGLDNEENRRFQAEQMRLHRHLQENVEDARLMETKMAEISSLMGQFADKITEQQSEIELIQEHAQSTKSNLTKSNEILESARQIGSGYGFMIFCIYVFFSILLHLIHYINR